MLMHRVLIIVVGLVLAYFAAYLGDYWSVTYGTEGFFGNKAPTSAKAVAVIAGICLIVGVAIQALLLWAYVFPPRPQTDEYAAPLIMFGVIMSAHAFGVIVTPFETVGALPFRWFATSHAFILWFALAPLAFAMHDTLVEAKMLEKLGENILKFRKRA